MLATVCTKVVLFTVACVVCDVAAAIAMNTWVANTMVDLCLTIITCNAQVAHITGCLISCTPMQFHSSSVDLHVLENLLLLMILGIMEQYSSSLTIKYCDISLSTCLSIILLGCQALCLSVRWSVRLSFCSSVGLLFCLSVCLSIYLLPFSPFVYLSVCLVVSLSIHSFVWLSVCVSVSVSSCLSI